MTERAVPNMICTARSAASTRARLRHTRERDRVAARHSATPQTADEVRCVLIRIEAQVRLRPRIMSHHFVLAI